MEITELMTAFDAHHVEVEGMAKKLDAATQEIDRMNGLLAAYSVTGGAHSAETATSKRALAAFGAFAKNGDINPMAELHKAAGMSIGSDPDGGYTVVPEIDKQIIAYQLPVSPMRRLATVRTVSTAEFKTLINTGLPAAGWVGEQDARPQTAGAKLSELKYPTNELYAMPASTQSLLDDSFVDVGAFIAQTIAQEFTKIEGSVWISGDGIGKPRGLLTYPMVSDDDSTRPFGSTQYVATGNASGFATTEPSDALQTLVYTLTSPYRQQGATWLMNSSTAATIALMKDGQGRPLWQPSFVVGTPPALFGFPVEIDENMPNLASNAYPVAFGAFKLGYLIIDRIGIRILRDPYTAKPFVLFYTTKRVGGGMVDSKAVRFLKCATS